MYRIDMAKEIPTLLVTFSSFWAPEPVEGTLNHCSLCNEVMVSQGQRLVIYCYETMAFSETDMLFCGSCYDTVKDVRVH